MSIVTYNATSPYSKTSQSSWYLGNFVRRPIVPDITDTYVQISQKYHLRPDLFSYDTYGTTNYWWVFMERNIDIIRDPLYDFTKGTYIWIPTLKRLGTV